MPPVLTNDGTTVKTEPAPTRTNPSPAGPTRSTEPGWFDFRDLTCHDKPQRRRSPVGLELLPPGLHAPVAYRNRKNLDPQDPRMSRGLPQPLTSVKDEPSDACACGYDKVPKYDGCRDPPSYRYPWTMTTAVEPPKQQEAVYVIYETVKEAYQVESHGIVGIYSDREKANAKTALKFKKEYSEYLRGTEVIEGVKGFGEPLSDDEDEEDEEDEDFDRIFEFATAVYDEHGCLRLEVEDSGVGYGNEVELYVDKWTVQ